MATQPEDTKQETTATPATAPRKTSAVAPEATAQAARQTLREVTPPAGAPETPTPAKAPAKSGGTTPESKRKAARSTSGAARRGRTARGASTTAAPPRARAASARTAAVRAGTQRARLAPPPAAAVPVAALPQRTEGPAERAGHNLAEIVEASRTAGRTVADVVESAGDHLAAYHEQVAEATPVAWVADLARANADFTRAATRAYAGAARTLLRD
jgi:hypothetical protein